MTSDPGDTREVTVELNNIAKPDDPSLNPDADIFCSKTETNSQNTCTVQTLDERSDEDRKYFSVSQDTEFEVNQKDDVNNFFIHNDFENMNCTTSVASTTTFSRMDHSHQDQTFDSPYILSGSQTEGTPALQELKTMLQRQLEYYFSRENLAHDTFLVSQMDSDQYVPIITVANFNQVRRLTKDLKLIVDVLRESPNVEVDEAGEKVRPNYKCCVLILREIPENTAIKDIEALFSGTECPKFAKCEFVHNDSWYVTFDSDEDVQKAYRYLREEVRTFQGKPIMARIKAKPITRAPLIPHYKNGLRYQNPIIPSVSGQQEPATPIQQQQQQWTEQTQQGLPYTNEPSVPYGNQQVFPPFYPPTMLQACAPATPSTFEFGTIFLMNGLPPQAVFKSLNGNGHHGLHVSPGRSHKPQIYRNQHKHNSLGLEQKEAIPFVPSPPHGAAPMLNRGISGFGYLPYPYGNPYGLGMDMQDFFSYSKRYSHHNKQGLGNLNPSSSNYGAKMSNRSSSGIKESIDPKITNQTKSSADLQGKDSLAKQQRNHPRRKRKEEMNTKSEPRGGSNGSKGPDSKDIKPDSAKFDLEPASFPPLPGSQDSAVSDSDLFESRLSDVVKGTSKLSSGDSRIQVEGVSDQTSAVIEDSHSLANGDLSQAILTPPASPVIDERPLSCNSLAEGVCPPHPEPKQATPDALSTHAEIETKPQSIVIHNSINTNRTVSVSVVSSVHTVSPNLTGSLSSSTSTTCSSPLPTVVSLAPTKTMSIPIITNQSVPMSKQQGFSQQESTSSLVNGNIEVTIVCEEKGRKLTYSEVAQRAKESVEKLALEIKEKERQEAAARQQRHVDGASSKHQAPTQKPVQKDFTKPKTTEQLSNFKENERKTGNNGSGIVERERLHRISPRSPREEKREENVSKLGK
ncbi:uncharacterized protein LOC143258685 isoform X1 [Tachypleus tridentatus]|uniref:uncharacterized protein LOC143258685 isoform X1 n=1 Tax=Tachypleus tridentatus TaxID=6853 RepID=UPI003FD447E2